MFKKLIGWMESANFKSAAARGNLCCPNCGAKPGRIPSATDDVMPCEACGTVASALEWTLSGEKKRFAAQADHPPAGTRITRGVDECGSVIWNIPASGKSGGFLFFAIFWCAITGIVSCAALFGTSHPDAPDNAPSRWFMLLFLSVFWAVGLGLLYAAFRNKYARHRISANRENVILRRVLFGKSKDIPLPTGDIRSVAEVEFYQQNYQPVHGIEIRGSRGKLRFGSMLTDAEKAWLTADMRGVILGAPVDPSTTPDSRRVPPVGARQGYFSIPLPQAGSQLLPVGIMLLLMGSAFVCIGIFFLGDSSGPAERPGTGDAGIFDFIFTFFHQGFRILWTAMSGMMAASGLAVLIWRARTANRETRIEGTDSEIAIRTSRHGLVLQERVFPRAAVADIRSSVSGSSNSKTMKRVELIVGNKAEHVSRWMDGEKADALVNEVRLALF